MDDLFDAFDFHSESETSDGFQTNAAVSVVAPAAMQRPPTTMELTDQSHVGKFVVYLAVPGINQASTDINPFVVLARIGEIQGEGADLYYGVYDFACDQAQNHLKTITDGSWDVPPRVSKSVECMSWRRINVGVNLVVCILPRNSGRIIGSGGVLPSGTSSLIVSLLRASTHAHAVSFMESEHRERPPTSTMPRPLHRPDPGRTRVQRLQQEKLLGRYPCRAMWPCEIPCYDRGLLAETCPRTIRAESCPRARGFHGRMQANIHMQICHGLLHDDARLYYQGGWSYTCRFKVPGEDPCEFRSFKYVFNANEHMQTSHGLLSDDARLYAEVQPSTDYESYQPTYPYTHFSDAQILQREQLRQWKKSAQLRLRKRGRARRPGEDEVKASEGTAPVTAPSRMAELPEAAPHTLCSDLDLESLPDVATTRTMTPTPSDTPSSSSSCSTTAFSSDPRPKKKQTGATSATGGAGGVGVGVGVGVGALRQMPAENAPMQNFFTSSSSSCSSSSTAPVTAPARTAELPMAAVARMVRGL
jgi:hypothetical protein